MVERPTTVKYQIYEIVLMMEEGEKITSKEALEMCAQGTGLPATSAALASLAREKKPLLKVVGLKPTGDNSKRTVYVYQRTDVAESSTRFSRKKDSPTGFKRHVDRIRHRALPSKLETEVELHDGKYMTSIGW